MDQGQQDAEDFTRVDCPGCKRKLARVSGNLRGVVELFCRHCKKHRYFDFSITTRAQEHIISAS